ncbi:Hypothetical protein R9X50_00334900 [Acrodontium crateriforme]|uniref:VanZ-like domain-containing protein n=1 Tax=Acrodontium crateriforme TaxID=150365 RepID=A0AAQ3M359_9PEZI|nr:Hypothetical protein R9X50_00334900 [Acrodontium crateriforme]
MPPASLQARKAFAVAFVVELLVAAYLGLPRNRIPSPYVHTDKVLHFFTFFVLTATFYWIIEFSRRRLIHLTLLICTAGLGIGSEVVQALLPNGRDFDPLDIAANVAGSGVGLALCAWYHLRMLERRRKNKHYDIVPGDDVGDIGDDELGRRERDVELGEGIGLAGQESGVIHDRSMTIADSSSKATDVTDELDNWDENAEDWDDDEPAAKSADDTKSS